MPCIHPRRPNQDAPPAQLVIAGVTSSTHNQHDCRQQPYRGILNNCPRCTSPRCHSPQGSVRLSIRAIVPMPSLQQKGIKQSQSVVSLFLIVFKIDDQVASLLSFSNKITQKHTIKLQS